MALTRNYYQRSTSWNAQYSFTGKIKDAETGYNYVKKLRFFSSLTFGNEKQVFHYAHCLRRFGARYYDSGLSVWLSVDPLSDKYPTLSPYTYCANNPIMMVDPDGRMLIILGDLAQLVVDQLNNYTKMGLYLNSEGIVKKTNSGDDSPIDKLLREVLDETGKVDVIVQTTSNADLSGEFWGNKYTDGDEMSNETENVACFQTINPNVLGANDIKVGDEKMGGYVLHEIAEAYFGGLISLANKKSSPAAIVKKTLFGKRYPEGCVYTDAHTQANSIMKGGIYEEQKYRTESTTGFNEFGQMITTTRKIPTRKEYTRTN